MANFWENATPYLGAALTATGAGVGMAFGGPAGGAVGATAGGALGSLVTGAVNLSKDAPDFPGPSEEERALLARQMDLANRLSSIEGMTPQEVSSFTNMTLEQDLRAQQVINAYASVQKMSPLEKQIIQDRAETMRVSGQMDAREQLMRTNASFAGMRVGQALSAGQSAFGMASTVQTKEAQQRLQVLNFKKSQVQAFGQAMQAAGYGAVAAGQLYDKFDQAGRWDEKSTVIDATTAGAEGTDQMRDAAETAGRFRASQQDFAAMKQRAASQYDNQSPWAKIMDANKGFVQATGQDPNAPQFDSDLIYDFYGKGVGDYPIDYMNSLILERT